MEDLTMSKNSKKRIAILHSKFNSLGGAERVIINLARGLKQKGHYIEIFTFRHKSKEIKEIFKSLKIPFHIPASNRLIDFSLNYKIAGWIIRNCFKDFDVINVHNYPAYIWLYYAKQFAKYEFPKIIWVCHEPSRQLYPDLLFKNSKKNPDYYKEYIANSSPHMTKCRQEQDKKAVASLDTIFCNSCYTQSLIKEIYRKEAIPCHFGIDPEKWQGISYLPIPENPTIIAISRLEMIKNFETVLKAISLAVHKEAKLANQLKVKIGGSGSDEKRLKILTSELQLNNIVEFKGFIKDVDLPDFYMQSSFVVFIPLDEPMGLIPLEAGFFQRATLGSNQGGVPEIIKNGESGYLVDPFNVEEVAEKIIKLCDNKNLLIQLGKNAEKMVKEKFIFSKFIERFLNELGKK